MLQVKCTVESIFIDNIVFFSEPCRVGSTPHDLVMMNCVFNQVATHNGKAAGYYPAHHQLRGHAEPRVFIE